MILRVFITHAGAHYYNVMPDGLEYFKGGMLDGKYDSEFLVNWKDFIIFIQEHNSSWYQVNYKWDILTDEEAFLELL